MSLFDAYIFVDWSAANRASPQRPSANAVWLGELIPCLRCQRETYHRTRSGGVLCVLSALEGHVKENRRVLVGFDFPYGYPCGSSRALGLPFGRQPWWEIWTQLAARVQDAANNVNNRFVVAAELNAIAGVGHPGPFWGCPANAAGVNLQPRSPFNAGGGVQLPRLRIVETRLPRAQEAWKLFGAGSVGSQALVGIPYVHRLRRQPELAEFSRVWPFETGFTPSPSPDHGPFVLHAEIWPGVIEKRVQDLMNADCALIRDRAQVRAMCEWAAELDDRNKLGQLFSEPNGLGQREIETCVSEEGWILGAAGA